MKEKYYNIFCNCFPDMKMTYKRFCELLHKDSCIYYEYMENNEICAFAIVEDYAIRLICVIPSKQRQGVGSKLISDIERYAGNRGFDKIITGGVSSKLFIGAISESWGFFEKQGFTSVGECDEMILKLEDFQLDKLTLHGSNIAEYGWFDGKLEDIRTAVSLVDENWPQYFTNPKNIYVAKVNGEIASFCLVARVTEYLKIQGMDVSFIFFTGVAEWYEKIGYRTFLSEYFGVKQLG